MGLICFKELEEHEYNYKENFKKCIKCGDKYNIKKNSMRFHCRHHRPDINNICIDCNKNLNINSSNCFHVPKITLYNKLFG